MLGGQACHFLFERFLGHQIFVFLAFVPIFLGQSSIADKAHHAEQVVPESENNRSDTVKSSRRDSFGLGLLDLYDIFFSWCEGRQLDGTRSNPLSIDQGFTRPAFSLATAVLDELSSLCGDITEGLSRQGHGGFGFITLLKNDLDVSLESDLFQIGRWTFQFRQGFLSFPFGNVSLATRWRNGLVFTCTCVQV